jgi:hypothetical protein
MYLTCQTDYSDVDSSNRRMRRHGWVDHGRQNNVSVPMGILSTMFAAGTYRTSLSTLQMSALGRKLDVRKLPADVAG